MPKNLKRYYGLKQLHFIACSCYRRLPLLRSARAKNTFATILGQVRGRYGFALVGYSGHHKKRVEKLQYMHLNPVKHGLVVHPKDWPWSSFTFSSKRQPGLVHMDPVR
jgi:REP-associated tyrosine transposase